MAGNRDDFSKPTIRELGRRVNYHCSRPDCWKPTLGPSSNPNESVNLGKAAHITAAAAGGPRYDATLSKAERKSISNGIWMCGLHAELVDKDEKPFPVDLIKKWKEDAEERARIEAFTTQTPPRGKIVIELDEDDKEYLRSLALPPEETTDTILPRMIAAAEKNIETFINDEWPDYVIPLNLTLAEEHAITLDGLRQGVGVAETVNLVAAPGTGKTTTIIQLAGSILSTAETVAAYIPLREWDGQGSWFEFLIRRNAYRAFKPEHFMRLAYDGRLVLLLDGWNELNPTASIRAYNELKGLKRDFPQLGIVIGTRQQAQPINGVIIRIEGLNEEQQMELARQLRGKDGEALIDQAWRTPGVHELVSIPLYLTALLSSSLGATFPQTKEAVLSSFVKEHESAPTKASILRSQLFGFHKDMLEAIAIAANKAATTALPDEMARPAVAEAIATLEARRQLTPSLQLTTVLDVLVDTHLLIRTSSDSSVAFQHQQFQEWYASFHVEGLMVSASQDNADSRNMLKADILNWPAWEESILFACERLSRTGDTGEKAVAAAIIDALGIDPTLAADMIYRSATEVWPYISAKVTAFAKRWHKDGRVDRAVRFMITSGHAEFAEYIWPLISHSDNQIHLSALRSAQQFRPSVLGADAAKRLAALPEDVRADVVSEIAGNSGFDGMELAIAVATADKSPEVITEILQSLQFRHADRHVAAILETASDDVWQRMAQKGYPDKLQNASHNERLVKMRRELMENDKDAIQTIYHLADGTLADTNAATRITQILQSADFPLKDNRTGIALERAVTFYPQAVAEAILHRIAKGMELPYRAEELLQNIPPINDGPLVAVALDKMTTTRSAHAAYAVVGPVPVGKMMDALLALDNEFRGKDGQLGEPARKEYHHLMDAISLSRESSFLEAFATRAASDVPNRIRLMADLASRHGKALEKQPFKMSGDIEKQITLALENWIVVMLTSPDANRHLFNHIARAIERAPLPQYVQGLQKLLERDIAERKQEREEFIKSGRRGSSGGHMCYLFEYRKAFIAIGDAGTVELMKSYLPDIGFGFDAACVLLGIWNRDHPSVKDKRFDVWHDFSEVKARRARLQQAERPVPPCDFAEAIFDVVREYGKPDKEAVEQHHALRLAKIGLSMPHGDKRAEIDALLALPPLYVIKQDLFTALAIVGEVLPADRLIAAIHEVLEAGKKEPWRLEHRHNEIMRWVELFPFSDRPMALLEIMDLLPNEYQHPWQLRPLMTALSHSPHTEILEVLEGLAKRNVEMAQWDEWLTTVAALGTEASAHAVLNSICSSTINPESGGTSHWQAAGQLTHLIRKFPSMRDEALRRYEKALGKRAEYIVESALIDAGDIATLLKIIPLMADKKKSFDGRVFRAIEKLTIGERGSTEQSIAPLVEFRKQLFGMLATKGVLSAFAKSCLDAVEELRDEHGRISDEPRHPDITSGNTWPAEAQESELPKEAMVG